MMPFVYLPQPRSLRLGLALIAMVGVVALAGGGCSHTGDSTSTIEDPRLPNSMTALKACSDAFRRATPADCTPYLAPDVRYRGLSTLVTEAQGVLGANSTAEEASATRSSLQLWADAFDHAQLTSVRPDRLEFALPNFAQKSRPDWTPVIYYETTRRGNGLAIP